MTPQEIDEFLHNQRTLILSTVKKDGAPVSHALWFFYTGDAIYVNIQAKSFKYKNILHDNRVCALVEAGEQYLQLRGVMVQGRATKVDDPVEKTKVDVERDAKTARIGDGMESMPAWFHESRSKRLDRGDRVMLRISLDKVTSWDFSKVREHYAKRA
ncbi:MAG: pyridoxamine 5'-phosphate oxidase family protein [Chloroflexi bacterium]|nr:pyridoxamine 5'-phosphate oxidase family protein [Chloroflexota bacterium]